MNMKERKYYNDLYELYHKCMLRLSCFSILNEKLHFKDDFCLRYVKENNIYVYDIYAKVKNRPI
jgi:hypothetical protein